MVAWLLTTPTILTGWFNAILAAMALAAVHRVSWRATVAGGLLAGGYVFRVMDRALATPAEPLLLRKPIPLRLELVPLVLAILAVALGFLPLEPFGLLQIGRPDIALAVSP